MDTNLSKEIAQVVRDTLRDDLREQFTKQRHTARLYGGAGAAGLYGGAALTAALVLVLRMVMPTWAAALVVAVVLLGAAQGLRQSAKRGSTGVPSPSPDG